MVYDQERRNVTFSEKLTGNKRRSVLIYTNTLYLFNVACTYVVVRMMNDEDTAREH